jgi:ubiquinone/menaquinone biosynthesis C-methylase UbiE
MMRLTPDFLEEEFDGAAKGHKGGYERWRWMRNTGTRLDYERTKECIVKFFGKSRPLRMLEIGCGPGIWSRIFLKASKKLDLLDISKGMLDAARDVLGDGKVRYLLGDFQTFEFPESRKYDYIASIRSLEYMDHKPKAIKKMHSLLKKGGKIMIITKSPASELRKKVPLLGIVSKTPKLHRDQIRHDELEKMMMDAGFRKVKSHPVVIHPFFLFRTSLHNEISSRLYRKGHKMRMKKSRFIESYMTTAEK